MKILLPALAVLCTAWASAKKNTTATSTPDTANASTNLLDDLKPINPSKDSFHMQPVRVVHARAQGDSPVWKQDRFISSFYKDDFEKGYRAVFDSVNTASVEGALMYVQAECVNYNMREKSDKTERCKRKNNVNNIVFYEVEFVQTNETIAQFQESWETPEYGPQISLDSGKCTPKGGSLPEECLQYNGVNGQPNLGPFVGALSKNESRAPYSGTIWYAFPNTCPDQEWKEKTDNCRAKTRKGLCEPGQKPNGVDCTFSYRVLGWVPIDDVVGITSLTKEDGSGTYKNFTEWCMASDEHIEFEGDKRTNEWSKGLDFWSNPLDVAACDNRTRVMLDTYEKIQSGTFKSGLIDPEQVKHFVALPKPEDLTKKNPECYKNVKSCASGCKRSSYAQICRSCKSGEEGCKSAPSDFTFPTLAKATVDKEAQKQTEKDTQKQSSGSAAGSHGSKTTLDSSKKSGSSSASSSLTMTMVALVAVVVSVLVM